MRNLQFTFFLFCGIISLKTENTFAQNLQFNQAIFNTYGPGNADGNTATPLFTSTLVVGPNQVLKITSTLCTTVNFMSGTTTQVTTGYLTINDIPSNLINGTDLWLPAGTYTVKGMEVFNVTNGSFKGLISGVLYDIVP